MIDVAIPGDQNIAWKEVEKIANYSELKVEVTTDVGVVCLEGEIHTSWFRNTGVNPNKSKKVSGPTWHWLYGITFLQKCLSQQTKETTCISWHICQLTADGKTMVWNEGLIIPAVVKAINICAIA